MFKQQLRPLFLAKRQQLSPDVLQTFSQAISDHFFQKILLPNLHTIHSVHVYLPILKRNEIDTWFIIRHLWQHYPHITVVTSKTDLSQGTMTSYRLDIQTTLLENRWQILEPVNAIPFAEEHLDMVLLPLLCVDQHGHRVGYGKGCYDKFLTRCKPEVIKVGLSLFTPVAIITDSNERDVKLNFCVTPQELFTFIS